MRGELRAADGVRIEALYEPYAGPRVSASRSGASSVIVLAHGFTGAVDRPALRRVATAFSEHAAVVTFSFRGHGGSGGRSTVGDLEVLDLAAAVRWARSFGHERVTTVGFSMGGSVAVRHAALYGPGGGATAGSTAGPTAGPASRSTSGSTSRSTRVGHHTASESALSVHGGRTGARSSSVAPAGASAGDSAGDSAADSPADTAAALPDVPTVTSASADAVVCVSAPARWYYRGTAPMRRLHWAVQRPLGRVVARYGLGTRVRSGDWDPVPLSPVAAAPYIAPAPLLVVHGDSDPYFPLDHPRSLADAAGPEACELWIVPGFGHAEKAAESELLHRIGAWAGALTGSPAVSAKTRSPASDARRHHGSRDAYGPCGVNGTQGIDGTDG